MPAIRVFCASLIVTSVLVCVLSLKWRKLTVSLNYLMALYQVVVSLVPSDQYDRQSSLNIFFMSFVGFVWYYTDSGLQIMYNVVILSICIFLPHTLVY